MRSFLFFFVLLFPVLLFAQSPRFGNLTVFSEDGDKFFLVLNGERQNDQPQSNIRVEELVQPYYSGKIIFADSTMATITKNLQINDFDGKMMDVTYRIKRDKQKKPKLTAFSSIDVQSDFTPAPGVYVHRFGESLNADINVGNGTTRTTTTRTTTNTAGASINLPGVSMNISIDDPEEQVTTTRTTTVTRTTTGSNQTTISNQNNQNQNNNSAPCRGWAMKQSDFNEAKKTISDANFEATKLSTAKSITSANCLSSDQVASICALFDFEESKMEFAKYAFKYTIDPKNYFKVNNVFTFDTSKDELSRFISND